MDKKYIFIGALITAIVAEIFATSMLPVWREYFFNGIEGKQWEVFYAGMWYFVALMLVFAAAQGFKGWLSQRLGLIWRESLADRMLAKLDKTDVPNLEQRATEDARIASQGIIEIGTEVIISASIVAALVTTMDENIIWVGLAYIAVITAIALLFHKPLVNTEIAAQTEEAQFRLNVTLRKPFNFENARNSIIKLMRVKLGFSLFSHSKNNLLNVVPYLILIPAYLNGEGTLGSVMKGVASFDLLVINTTIIIIMYPRVTQVLASYKRIQAALKG